MSDKHLTRRIAAVLGPALIVATTSETLNLHIWSDNVPAMVYLNGLFLLVGGLIVVTVHFQWRGADRIMVSLAGCLLLLSGAGRMYFPEAQQPAPGPLTYALIGALCLYGVLLSAIAFWRSPEPGPQT